MYIQRMANHCGSPFIFLFFGADTSACPKNRLLLKVCNDSSFSALIVVVRQVVDDCICPVELFHEQQANHLVREGHF